MVWKCNIEANGSFFNKEGETKRRNKTNKGNRIVDALYGIDMCEPICIHGFVLFHYESEIILAVGSNISICGDS